METTANGKGRGKGKGTTHEFLWIALTQRENKIHTEHALAGDPDAVMCQAIREITTTERKSKHKNLPKTPPKIA